MRTSVVAACVMLLSSSCASLLGIEEGTQVKPGGAGGTGAAGGPVSATGTGGVGGGGGSGGVGGTCEEPVVGMNDVIVITDANPQFLDVVVARPNQGVVVAGRYQDAFAFGGLPTATGNHCFVAWLDQDGDVSHAIPLVSTAFCLVHDMVVDDNGGVTVVGEFGGSLTIDRVPQIANRARDGFVVHLDSVAGEVMWFRQFYSGLTPLRVKAVALDPADNSVWLGGDYDGEVLSDGDELFSSNDPTNGPDVFLAHYDAEGRSMGWAGLLGQGTQTLEAMVLAADGSLIVGGTFVGLHWSIPVQTPNGIDGWFAHVDVAGGMAPTVDWIQTVRAGDQGGEDRVDALAVGANGNIFVGGSAGATTFGPGASGVIFDFPNDGGFVAEVNTTGGYVALTPILANPPTAVVTLSDLVIDQRQDIYVAGVVVGGTSLQVGATPVASLYPTGFGFVSRLDTDGNWLAAILLNAEHDGSPVSSVAAAGCDVWCAGTFGPSTQERYVVRGNIAPIIAAPGDETDGALVRFRPMPER